MVVGRINLPPSSFGDNRESVPWKREDMKAFYDPSSTSRAHTFTLIM
jgi:hypothetical protein